jgi:hypothetical protein
MNAIGDFSAPLNGDQPYHIAQRQETTGCGLRWMILIKKFES